MRITPESLLVRLKNKLSLELGINAYSLKLLIDKFITNVVRLDNSSKAHYAKVNIYNELTKEKMTIKVFFKFLRILNIKRVRFDVTIVTMKDKEITVSEEVTLSHLNEEDF